MNEFPNRAAALLALMAGPCLAVPPLPALHVDSAAISVSGLSSGAFLANQLGYAYADTFMGVGVFAGGPYDCAGLNNYLSCMYDARISAAQRGAMQHELDSWSGQANDRIAAVGRQRIFLWVGGHDFTVGPNPMAAVLSQYLDSGVPRAQLDVQELPSAGHTFPTDFDAAGDSPCASTASPYISNCGYDGAGAMLQWIYGPLAARNDAPPATRYLAFDQTPYAAGNPGLASSGWIYVPADCAGGAVCRLHVALHGCLQNAATIGSDFIDHTGYTRWADTNHIIVLFPQTQVDDSVHTTADSGLLPNGNGCWDWIGWYGPHFAQKAGVQMSAIMAMVRQLSSGTK